MLMDAEDILEALEGSAPCPRVPGTDRVRTAEQADVVLWRDALLRFLGELDGDVSVQEIRVALEDY